MAGGAGGHEVERIAVKVVPDTGGFKEKLKAFLERAEAGSKVEVDVELKGEAEAEAKLKKLAKDLTVKVQVELKGLANARRQLAQLLRDRTIHVDIDVDDALARSQIGRSFRTRKLKINADLDLTTARARLRTFLRPRRIKIYADIDRRGFMEMAAGLGYIFRLMNGVSRQITQASQAGQAGLQQMSRSASTFGGIIRPIYLVALPFLVAGIYLLIGAVAGLVIALGAAVGGLLLMLPPIAALGAGIAYVLKSSDKQAKKLRKQFESVGKTAERVLRKAVKPMTRAIQEEIPYVKEWIKTLEGPLHRAFKGASQYVGRLSLGVQQFVDNALAGLVGALTNPEMEEAMNGFRRFLASIGTALGSFFSTLAEGGSDYGEMFDSLGDALVKIAPALARMLNAFASVSPEIINSLADNLVEIFGILSDPNVLDALTRLSTFSFDTVVWGLRLISWQIIYTVNLWTWMWHAAQRIFNIVKKILTDFWNHLRDTWNKAVNWTRVKAHELSASATGPLRSFVIGVKGLLDWLRDNFVHFWSRLVTRSSSGANRTRAAALGPFNGMASAISGIMDRIVGIVSSAWSRISGIVGNIAGAVSRAKGLVSGLSGLASKINPFNLFSAPADDGDTAPKTFAFTPPPPDEPVLATFSAPSIYDAVDDMAHVDRELRRKYQSSRSDEIAGSPTGKGDGISQRIFNFTTYAAPNEPTEKQFVKWLDYAETMYAH